ncbi:aldehyde dehydrogenase [Pontibacter chitinilyticus]|uniref:aldehyde dehydrogenase n=1 Tax=Pontibacter chitinilyticus TaxID=2674989 RepID=UPI00321921CF
MSDLNSPHSPLTPATSAENQIRLLLEKQRIFFNSGKTLDMRFRKERLQGLQHALHHYEQDLMEALYADFRKPELESFTTEIGYVALELKLTLKKLEKWAKPKRVGESILNFPAKSYIYTEPYGVSLIIGPWNYPLNLVLNPLIGAIAAGNCAVVKPSELTTHTSAVVARMLRESFEEDHVAVVEGGPETTQHLLVQRFDYIFFTGSTRVGRIVLKAAAEHLTPVTLELGGKSPAIITLEADLELAARRIAWGKFMNAGQTCVAPDYVLVREQVKEEFIDLLGQCIREFYGEDPAKSPDFARIINDSHFDRLANLLHEGNIRMGGQTDATSRYIAPTVLDEVTWDDPVMQEEIFGPILPVLSFQDQQDAITQVNSHEKPLALYYFSSDKAKQQELLEKVPFGGGCINDTISHLANPNLPFGGVGSSGMGSYHGQASFDLFSHKKSVVHRGTWLDLPLRYPPYNKRLAQVRRLFKWL